MRPCPICASSAGEFPENPHAPFCSERCKLIDLGNWLDQGYRVPIEDDALAMPNEDELLS